MTRPLTAAETAVEREWLLEHGRSAEEVGRMQAVAPGFVYALEEHVSWEGETLIAVCPTEQGARAMGERYWRQNHAEEGEPSLSFAWNARRGRWTADAQRREYWISKMPLFSPPETPAATNTHRPPSPHEGMGISPDPSSWRCGTCGHHACICDSFPGHGAG